MKDLAEALRGLLSRIGEFFDIFDLSFVVSGAVALSALVSWWKGAGRLLPLPSGGWLRVFAIVLACYVAGLFCFAIGRWMRFRPREGNKNDKFMQRIHQLTCSHGLCEIPEVNRYFALDDDYKAWRLYLRLWAELRENLPSSPSLVHLNRAWVLAATFDGVSVAALLWVLVFVAWMFGIGLEPKLQPGEGLPFAIGLAIGAFALRREARRTQNNQADELFATISAARGKLLYSKSKESGKALHNAGV